MSSSCPWGWTKCCPIGSMSLWCPFSLHGLRAHPIAMLQIFLPLTTDGDAAMGMNVPQTFNFWEAGSSLMPWPCYQIELKVTSSGIWYLVLNSSGRSEECNRRMYMVSIYFVSICTDMYSNIQYLFSSVFLKAPKEIPQTSHPSTIFNLPPFSWYLGRPLPHTMRSIAFPIPNEHITVGVLEFPRT